jgi:hypothetical protein
MTQRQRQRVVLSVTISELAREWLAGGRVRRIREINAGPCHVFAREVIARMEERGVKVRLLKNYRYGRKLPRHGWLGLNGMHHDAESPDGVVNWRHLRIFKDHFEAISFHKWWAARENRMRKVKHEQTA